MEAKKFESIKRNNSKLGRPSDLVCKYLAAEESGLTLRAWLMTFEFNNINEISSAIKELAYAVACDADLSNKEVQKNDGRKSAIFKRFSEVVNHIGQFEKYPNTTAAEIWHGGYSRLILDRRVNDLFSAQSDTIKYETARKRIMQIYSLSDMDVEKIHYFIEQVKAGAHYPNSLRRMLYIYGSSKKTGKTTVATNIVALLNGYTDAYAHRSEFESTLDVEMQISSFAVPRISELNCALMDECFFRDMGKTYAGFKRFMTSSDGRARLPYGQEFAWIGRPNYVATSNEPLSTFIRDWEDRRYLSVEFKSAPTENLSFAEISQLWQQFVLNSKMPDLSFEEWAEVIFDKCNEVGERQEESEGYEIQMRQSSFLDFILALNLSSTAVANPDNHLTVKRLQQYFAIFDGVTEVKTRKQEIASAFRRVFGAEYGGQKWWLLSDIKKIASEMKGNILSTKPLPSNAPF